MPGIRMDSILLLTHLDALFKCEKHKENQQYINEFCLISNFSCKARIHQEQAINVHETNGKRSCKAHLIY